MLVALESAAQLVDAETHQLIHSWSFYPGYLKCVAFSPDSQFAVTCDSDNLVKLWDIQTLEPVHSFMANYSYGSSIVFSPDGRYMLIVGGNPTIQLWEIQTGQLLRVFGSWLSETTNGAISPDGRYILTGGEDKIARLWDVQTGENVRAFVGHTASVLSVSYSSDGRYILTGSKDNTARLWDVQTARTLRTLKGHNYAVLSVAFSSDDRYILTGSLDTRARLWDARTGQVMRIFTDSKYSVDRVALTVNKRYILTVQPGAVVLWESGLEAAGTSPPMTLPSTPDPVQTSTPPLPTATWISSITPPPAVTALPVPPTVEPASANVVTENKQWSRLMQQFDGVMMVKVPPGCFKMGSDVSELNAAPINEQCFDKSFWIDFTKVTQTQFKRFGGQAANLTNPIFAKYLDFDHLPVSGVTWFEARDFCEKRGGRLPTEAEWEYAARGPDSLIYPWGNEGSRDAAPSPPIDEWQVSNPYSASWVGARNLVAYGTEWTSSLYKPYPYNAGDGRENSAGNDAKRVLRGSQLVFDDLKMRSALRVGNSPYNSGDNGFRCVFPDDTATQKLTQLRSISTPDIPQGVKTNNQWTPNIQQFNGVDMVEVPAGCFTMGSTQAQIEAAVNPYYSVDLLEEWPTTRICFDTPFWIDKTEISWAQFRRMGGKAVTRPGKDRQQQPVRNITWAEARDFCRKRGGRLPTEAEWEYAARGPDSLIYPWGNRWDANLVIWNRDYAEGVENIGQIPDNASWVGALDMIGNVAEWTSTVYKPYPYNTMDERENPTNIYALHVQRGGSFRVDDAEFLRSMYRRSFQGSTGTWVDVGFRCVHP